MFNVFEELLSKGKVATRLQQSPREVHVPLQWTCNFVHYGRQPLIATDPETILQFPGCARTFP